MRSLLDAMLLALKTEEDPLVRRWAERLIEGDAAKRRPTLPDPAKVEAERIAAQERAEAQRKADERAILIVNERGTAGGVRAPSQRRASGSLGEGKR